MVLISSRQQQLSQTLFSRPCARLRVAAPQDDQDCSLRLHARAGSTQSGCGAGAGEDDTQFRNSIVFRGAGLTSGRNRTRSGCMHKAGRKTRAGWPLSICPSASIAWSSPGRMTVDLPLSLRTCYRRVFVEVGCLICNWISNSQAHSSSSCSSAMLLESGRPLFIGRSVITNSLYRLSWCCCPTRLGRALLRRPARRARIVLPAAPSGSQGVRHLPS